MQNPFAVSMKWMRLCVSFSGFNEGISTELYCFADCVLVDVGGGKMLIFN